MSYDLTFDALKCQQNAKKIYTGVDIDLPLGVAGEKGYIIHITCCSVLWSYLMLDMHVGRSMSFQQAITPTISDCSEIVSVVRHRYD